MAKYRVNYLYDFRYRRKLEFSSEKVKWFLIENSKKLNVFTKNECIELSFAVVETRVFRGSFEGYFWVTHTRVDTSFRASKKMFNITSNDVNYKIFLEFSIFLRQEALLVQSDPNLFQISQVGKKMDEYIWKR